VREIEFLPEHYIRARFQRRIGFIRSWLLLALGLAMVLWSLQVGEWVREAQAELLALQNAGAAVEGDVSKVRLLRAEAKAYDRRLSLVQTLRAQTSFTDVLVDLAAVLPDSVVLEDMTMGYPETGAGSPRRPLCLRGAAAKETTVTQMLSALENSKRFERPVLVESKPYSREDAERRSFVLEVQRVSAVPAKEQ
jgi:Tfp pilus assembly protein PilN